MKRVAIAAREGHTCAQISFSAGGTELCCSTGKQVMDLLCTCLLLSLRRMSGAGKRSIAGLGFTEVV